MPFLAMTVIVLLGAVGICIDFQRDFQAAAELSYAATDAASYALSMSTSPDGSYTQANAQAQITQALQSGLSSINLAQLGPQSSAQNQPWSGPVNFSASDINFVPNPNQEDANDFFLQLTARRDGDNALKQFFLPLFNTSLTSNANLPLSTINSRQTIELISQPATRIGPGALNAASGSRAAELAGFAAFPLAISNQQFQSIAAPSQTGTNYTIDLVSSQSVQNPSAPNHMKGALVNLILSAGTNSDGTYSAAQGNQAINQLEGLISYFGATSTSQTLAPSLVESGSNLSAFDTADPAFVARQSELSQELASLTMNKYYIIPVLANDPQFSSTNSVIGFARLLLSSAQVTNGVVQSFSVQLGESVPVRNAVAVFGYSNAAPQANTVMPAAVAPFLPRQIDNASGGISTRSRGVVMAPALSPRNLKTAR
jgi:hypothetical protein